MTAICSASLAQQLPRFGRALTAKLRRDLPPDVQLRLPFLTLEVDVCDPQYRQLCQAMLCAQQAEDGAPPEVLRLAVCDQRQQPELRPPQLDASVQGQQQLTAAFEAAGMDAHYDATYQSWQFYDPDAATGLQLMRDSQAYPPWERTFPLRNFLHWAYARQGRRLLHAGSLGHHGRGALLAGAGGAGKSGTTLAGILAGLQSVGDDYLLIDPKAARPIAYPLLTMMKQDPAGLARLQIKADPQRFGSLNWQGKYEFALASLAPDSRAAQLALHAVLLPRITGAARSQIRPASAREVVLALLPNNLQQLPGQMPQGMAVIADLARRLPGYHLALGQDPAEIAATIAQFLEGLPCD